jgi:H+/Cl- antiporter ClcA
MLGGASTAVFLRVLDRGIALAAAFPYPFVMLPLGFAASVLLVQWLAPQARGHGTEKIIEAVHMRWGRIPFLVAPVKLVATVLTISVGGSVGREGPAAQIGAALASALASALWLQRPDRRKLVICGISAGFASVFGTPIAGAIFGVEVLVMGSLFYEVVYPSFIAGIVAYQTSIHLGSTYFHQTIGRVPVPGEGIFLQMVGTGIAIGGVAIVMIESLRVADVVAHAIRAPRWLVGAGGGVLLAGLAWLTSPRYLGLGIDTMEHAVTGAPVPAAACVLKIVFTAVSLASGGSGESSRRSSSWGARRVASSPVSWAATALSSRASAWWRWWPPRRTRPSPPRSWRWSCSAPPSARTPPSRAW